MNHRYESSSPPVSDSAYMCAMRIAQGATKVHHHPETQGHSDTPSLLRKTMRIFSAIIPWAVLLGIAVISLTLKMPPVQNEVKPKLLTPRDKFLGITVAPGGELFLAGPNGQILSSVDQGAKWILHSTGLDVRFQNIKAWDMTHVLAVGNGGMVAAGLNQQDKWEFHPVSVGEQTKLIGLAVQGEGHAWAVGDMGGIFYSPDYGSTWQRLRPVEDVTLNGVDFINTSTGVVVGEFGTILRTTDGGKTWSAYEKMTDLTLLGVAFTPAGKGVIVGQLGTVLISDDAGASWQKLSSITQEHLLDAEWDAAHDTWVVVGNKGIICQAPTSQPVRWTTERLAVGELTWHTGVAAHDGAFYLAGETSGVSHNGRYSPFQAQTVR